MMVHVRFSICCICVCLANCVSTNTPAAADKPVKFDVPAIVAAQTRPADLPVSPNALINGEKTIQVVIPVSTELDLSSKERIEAFRFDVFWHRDGFQVADYAPRSETFSDISGDVLIESNEEDNAGGRLHLQGGFKSAVNGDASVDVGRRESIRKKYTRRAQQEILIASGTSHRGTGAFFRFHRSSQELLEGGRELTIQFRVPNTWRASVLRVDCFAKGSREVFGSWTEPYERSRTFVVPVFLTNDPEAKAAATKFARAEQRLRKTWQTFQSSKNRPAYPPLPAFFSAAITPKERSLPSLWAHYLIQSGNDAYLEKYHSQLPETVASSAENFVIARRTLMRMQ